MLGLKYDADSLGLELAVEPLGDVRGEPLLDLQVPSEQLDDAAELAEADQRLAGEIADVCHSVERQQVMHAQRVKRDRAGDDQLVVALVGKGGRPERPWRQQLGIRVSDAPGCL